MKVKFFSLLLMLGIFFITGCGNNNPQTPTNIADNVNQHILIALKMAENNNIQDAKNSINRALKLDPKNSMAWSTKALIEKNPQLLQKSKNFENSDLDRFFYYISAIRLSNREKDIKSYYNLAYNINTSELIIPYYHDKSSLDFFTGKRFFELAKYKEAKKYFANVFNQKNGSKFAQKAHEWWKKTDRIVRALKLAKWSLNAKKIVAKDRVSRVDAAVVLVDDLHLEKLLKGAFNPYINKPIKLPEDIKNHPNLYELKIIYRYNLRGLNSIIKNGKIVFAPNDPITREEFAMVLEDIVSKYKHDPKYKTKYFGSKSPFVDVKASSASFNAIMNAVSMGFMNANTYGEFHPKKPLSGVELIEAISKIKEELSL